MLKIKLLVIPISSLVCTILLLLTLLSSIHAENSSNTDWSNSDIETIEKFSFKYIPQLSVDPSNRYLYNSEAIKLGKDLFNETGISNNKRLSCSSCHLKESAFTDNRTVAIGIRTGFRNTPTLLNVAEQNWFFWDGSKDSLWAQALSSIENPAELGFSRVQMLHFISTNPLYRKRYESTFNDLFPDSHELSAYPKKAGPHANLDQLVAWKKLSKDQKKKVNRVFTNIGKAIAAYVSTLKSEPTRFDKFVNELVGQGHSSVLNESEQKGLRLFISKKSGCSNCHSGALFSNKEFFNIGTGIRAFDNGRSEIIDAVIWDEFNCLGGYSDAQEAQCPDLKYVNRNKHELAGTYKTPSLRNLSKTAPYMHDGRFKSLKEVLEYYASIDKEKSKEIDMAPVNLSEEDQIDIVSFLLTL